MPTPADDFAHTLDVHQRLDALDMSQPSEALRAAQITRWQQRLRHTLVQVPLHIAPDLIERQGYEALRHQLRAQFVSLSRDERLKWLTNFLFFVDARPAAAGREDYAGAHFSFAGTAA
jgi:hypothetical protein